MSIFGIIVAYAIGFVLGMAVMALFCINGRDEE